MYAAVPRIIPAFVPAPMNVGELFGQDLYSDFTLQPHIAGAKHFAHSAFAEKSGDFVSAELGADVDGHEWPAIIAVGICIPRKIRVAELCAVDLGGPRSTS
jgi:hypothetical protein